MKTLRTLIVSLFTLIALQASAQDFVGSTVRFAKEIETGGKLDATHIGLIKLNDQNDEFVFDIPLYPILTSPRDNDSITTMNKNIMLHYRADFPVSDLDFLANDGSESSFVIPGELTINNITRPVKMNLSVHGAAPYIDEARGIKSYPALISFTLEINPAEYNLDFETINFVRTIYVEVRNGVINNTTETSIVR
jgi:hypothetical protein